MRMMASALKRIATSPLVHFPLAGAVSFGLAAGMDFGCRGSPNDPAAGDLPPVSDDAAILRVERDALMAFIQSQYANGPGEEEATQSFDSATHAVRQDWIDRYVREEALVREARALGLDRDDELVRRRLVQQMEFLVEGQKSRRSPCPTRRSRRPIARGREDLRDPATLRFAHVFSREIEGTRARRMARRRSALFTPESRAGRFDGALTLGDRFLYDRTYVDRTLDEIRSHFGETMAKTVAKSMPDLRPNGPARTGRSTGSTSCY